MLSKSLILITTLCLLAAPSFARDLNVADLGAVGDGVQDNTAIFQKALNEVGNSGGGVVNVPAGRFRINGNLAIPATVTLQGTYRVPPTSGFGPVEDPANLRGSVLFAYAGRGNEQAEPFIRLVGPASTIAGFIIYYPEWKYTDNPPVPYPPTILSQDSENVGILDCNLVNGYDGIRLVRAHRHLVRNVQGYPVHRALYVDECYDIGRVENIHFWPFGVLYNPSDWVALYGVAMEFARTDWQYVSNCFCFGYGVGYRFSKSEHGSCNGSFLCIGADSCEKAVLVEDTPAFGLLITNGEFVGRWSGQKSVAVEVLPTCTGKVSLVNCSFWGPLANCIWMRAPAGQLTATACAFTSWDIAKTGAPALRLDAGRSIIQGNNFGSGDVHVSVAKEVASAIIMGNQADGGLVVDNFAGKRTKMGLNEEPEVVLTGDQKAHYRLMIGSPNDQSRIRRWHGSEPSSEWGKKGTKRWSSTGSQLILPVIPGKKYTITMEVHMPKYAWTPEAGIYLGNKLIAAFPNKSVSMVTGTIPASSNSAVILSVKCKNWVPKDHIPGNNDTRVLGVAVRTVTMRATGAGEKIFDANTGKWITGK